MRRQPQGGVALGLNRQAEGAAVIKAANRYQMQVLFVTERSPAAAAIALSAEFKAVSRYRLPPHSKIRRRQVGRKY